MSLLTSILISLCLLIVVVGAVAFFAVSAHCQLLPPRTPPLHSSHPRTSACLCQYPPFAARRRESAFRAKIALRLSSLFNAKESLQQHIDWALADNRPHHTARRILTCTHIPAQQPHLCCCLFCCSVPDRARALQAEVRSMDEEMVGLEKELAILDQQKRRQAY